MRPEGILSFLTSIVKKKPDNPTDEVGLLSIGVKVLADRIMKMAETVVDMALIVSKHHDAINELYAVQAVILSKMNESSGTSTQMPDLHKEKSEKPN